jgi:hypothetical protein
VKEFNFVKYIKSNPLLKEDALDTLDISNVHNVDNSIDYKADKFWELGGQKIYDAIGELIENGYSTDDIARQCSNYANAQTNLVSQDNDSYEQQS